MGMVIPPMLTPKKKYPVTAPVIFIRDSAKAISVGKMEDNDKPKPIDPIQIEVECTGKRMINPRKDIARTKFPINNRDGAIFLAKGTEIRRPKVSAPQKNEFR